MCQPAPTHPMHYLFALEVPTPEEPASNQQDLTHANISSEQLVSDTSSMEKVPTSNFSDMRALLQQTL